MDEKQLNDLIKAGRHNGEEFCKKNPHAVHVQYRPAKNEIEVTLSNDCRFAFPVKNVQSLETLKKTDLGKVKITGAGYALLWEEANIDVYLPALMEGIFGTRAFMASKAGKATSKKKALASRKNGQKGGRPKKHKVAA